MNKGQVKGLINKGNYSTIKELRLEFGNADISSNGNVELIIGDWRVMLGKIEGIYKVASITKKNSL